MSKLHQPTQDGLYTARDLARYVGVEHTSILRWYKGCLIPPCAYSGTLIRPWQGGGPIRTHVWCWSQSQADYIRTLVLPPNPDGIKGAPRISRAYYNKALTEPSGVIETLPIPVPEGWGKGKRLERSEDGFVTVVQER